MAVTFGEKMKIEIYGQSHAEAIGVRIEGLPAGMSIDQERLQAFLDRRAPGRNEWSTSRKEPDKPVLKFRSHSKRIWKMHLLFFQ